MKDRVLCRYRSGRSGEWYLWFTLSQSEWENGVDFPEGDPANFEYKDIWISVDHDYIQTLLNTPDVDAEIENVPENQ